MKKPQIIGIESDNNSISDFIYCILQNSYNTILVKDNNIKTKNRYLKLSNYSDIHEILKETKSKTNILIIDSVEKDILKEVILNNQLDLIVNTKSKETQVTNNTELYQNLSKNGIIIANGDSKYIFNYFNSIKDKMIINYGLSPKTTLTASSIGEIDIESNDGKLNICLQRGITTKFGDEIEPMEFPIPIKNALLNKEDILPIIGTALIYGISIDEIQKFFYDYK